MGRPSTSTLRDLELQLARSEAIRDHAERTLQLLIDGVTRALGSGTAAALGALTVVQPTVEPETHPITPLVLAAVERWSETPQQRSKNLTFVYGLARKGKNEREIIAALRRGEVLETTS